MNLQELFEESKNLAYNSSNGMKAVEVMRGPGFFPGCIGTALPSVTLEGFPIMVLGQDFDTESNHVKIDKLKGEIDSNSTWRNLRKLLKDIEVDVNKCFFTNAYMGLRPNKENHSKAKNTGKSPAAKKGAETFAVDCYTFFNVQLKALKPEIVLVLGKEPVRFLCNAFKSEFDLWRDIRAAKHFYDKDCLSTNIVFEGRNIQFVFVIHPSFNGSNRAIIWGKEKGKYYEQEMLRTSIPGHLKSLSVK